MSTPTNLLDPDTPLQDHPPSRWSAGRVVAIVLGSLLALVSLGLVVGGGAVLVADETLRDDDGYLTSSLMRVDAPGHAVASESIELRGTGSAIPERWLGKAKVEATAIPEGEVFVGIARTPEVEAYLGGVAHSVVADAQDGIGDDDVVRLDDVSGGPVDSPPTAQDFWAASASGTGTRTMTWDVESGDWTLVVMNTSGTGPVVADVTVGATVPALDEIGLALLVTGLVLGLGAVLALVLALRRPAGVSHQVA